MARNYVALPFEYLEEFEELTYEEVGRLVCALLHYGATGEDKKPEGREGLLWRRVVNQENRFQESYEEVLNSRREAGRKGAEARWGKREEPSGQDDLHSKNSKAIFAIGKHSNTETKTKTETKTETETESKTKLCPSSEGGVYKAPLPSQLSPEAQRLMDKLEESRRRLAAIRAEAEESYSYPAL